MNHAILVEGFGNGQITQSVINVLDSSNIDFFIHWDVKSKLPEFTSKKSRIYFLHRKNVHWAGTSLMDVEIALLKEASKNGYDYYHLISSSDMVIMSYQYFNDFFAKHYGINYINFDSNPEKFKWRMKYYFEFQSLDIPRRLKYWLQEINGCVQSIIGIDRTKKYKKINFGKGEHWVSITSDLVSKLVSSKSIYYVDKFFRKTFISDEMWLQTMVNTYFKSDINIKNLNSCAQNARLINWEKGNPYIYTSIDLDYLGNMIDTEFAFVRKVDLELARSIEKVIREGKDVVENK